MPDDNIVRKDKLIRNMDDGLWNRAKSMAQRKNLKMRQLIEKLLKEWTEAEEQLFADEINGKAVTA